MVYWITVALVFAGSIFLQSLVKRKTESPKPAGIGDFNFPTTTELRHIPILWGTDRLDSPNIMWWGDYRAKAVTKKVKTGIFSSDNIITGYNYYFGSQQGLVLGPDVRLRRCWNGDKLVFEGDVTHLETFTIDAPALFGGDDGGGGFSGTFKFFAGEVDQPVSSYLSQFLIVDGQVSRYPLLCYVTENASPTLVGRETQVRSPAYELSRFPNQLGVPDGKHIVLGYDSNLACCAYELLTDARWGLGALSSDINEATFLESADILYDEGNGISLLIDSSTTTKAEVLRIIERQADCIIDKNPLTGKWEMRLIREAMPSFTLDTSTIVNVESYKQGTWATTKNFVNVAFKDRDQDYKERGAPARDFVNISIQGGRIIREEPSFPGIRTAKLANHVAWRELRTLAYPLAQLTVVCNRSVEGVRRGDVVLYNDPRRGAAIKMRVISANYGDLLNGEIVIEAVQDLVGDVPASFADPESTLWQDSQGESSPILATNQVFFERPYFMNVFDLESFSITNGMKTSAGAYLAWPQPAHTAIAPYFRSGSSPLPPTGSLPFESIGGNSASFAPLGSIVGLGLGASVKPFNPLNELVIAGSPALPEDFIANSFNGYGESLGSTLANLLYVTDGTNEEFIFFEKAFTFGTDSVRFTTLYRGVLDTVVREWPAGTPVYLVRTPLTTSLNVYNELALVPVESGAEVISVDDAVPMSLQRTFRARRPYPPSAFLIGGTRFSTTVSLEQVGGGVLHNYGFSTKVLRKFFAYGNETDQVMQDVFELSPTLANADDPEQAGFWDTIQTLDIHLGGPTGPLLFTKTSNDGFSSFAPTILRREILRYTDAVAPVQLTFKARATHTYALGEDYNSRYDLVHTFNTTSYLQATGIPVASLGARPANTATATSGPVTPPFFNWRIDLGQALTTGIVQISKNGGGSWTTVLNTGVASATFSATTGETFTFRHTSTTPGMITEFEVTNTDFNFKLLNGVFYT